jgi:hypothetical protein
MNTLKLNPESLAVETFPVEGELRPLFSITGTCTDSEGDGCPVDPNGTKFCTAESCTGAFACPCD